MILLIPVAFKQELTPFLKTFTLIKETPFQFYKGKVSDHIKSYIVITGIGKVAAASATQWGINQVQPNGILSAGFAGGLQKTELNQLFQIGEVLESDVYPKSRQKSILADLTLEKTNLKSSTLITTDIPVTDQKKKGEILQIFPVASLVDMETAAIAKVAKWNKIKWAGIRIVSDKANQSFNQDFKARIPELAKLLSNEIIHQINSMKNT